MLFPSRLFLLITARYCPLDPPQALAMLALPGGGISGVLTKLHVQLTDSDDQPSPLIHTSRAVVLDALQGDSELDKISNVCRLAPREGDSPPIRLP